MFRWLFGRKKQLGPNLAQHRDLLRPGFYLWTRDAPAGEEWEMFVNPRRNAIVISVRRGIRTREAEITSAQIAAASSMSNVVRLLKTRMSRLGWTGIPA